MALCLHWHVSQHTWQSHLPPIPSHPQSFARSCKSWPKRRPNAPMRVELTLLWPEQLKNCCPTLFKLVTNLRARGRKTACTIWSKAYGPEWLTKVHCAKYSIETLNDGHSLPRSWTHLLEAPWPYLGLSRRPPNLFAKICATRTMKREKSQNRWTSLPQSLRPRYRIPVHQIPRLKTINAKKRRINVLRR